ncbi:MAG TPA: RNA 3'-terminal phosphate cyclase [Anaerohalosphaeraceae bacterium]|nr:RNA 3'-terminal phosphate cyclase [Anaerohalosphaeraceae bacterium]
MIIIDGSFGEGGGQILRSSLALSLITGKPFQIRNIRAGRKNPGLMRQHLTAVNAAVEVGQAEVSGNQIGSAILTFSPKTVIARQYHFSVGTAGSTTLVLQTILPALLVADAPSEIILEGGTHNPFAPPYSFLEKVFVPVLRQMGPDIALHLQRPGFYPAGGGCFTVTIQPKARLQRIDIMERGEIIHRSVKAYVANLPKMIGQRELGVIRSRLSWDKNALELIEVTDSHGPGNIVTAEIQSEKITELFTGFGMKGLPADQVPLEMIQEVRDYLDAGVPVGRHLADQIMIPMAMAGGGRFRTLPLTLHSTTNLEILKQFLDIRVEVTKENRNVYQVNISS